MSFSSDIQKYTEQYRKRMAFVAKDAAQRVVNSAQQTVYKNGRMPLDTGFLRASGVAAIGTMPSGESTPQKERYSEGETVGEPVSATLIRWNPSTQDLYFGWTAAYAARLEYGFQGTDSLGRTYNQSGYGYLRGATERWPEFVRRAVNAADRSNL